MKKMKENFLALMGMMALTLALIVFYVPEAQAAGSQQYQSTTCTNQNTGESWACNNCTSGKKACTDNDCLDCQPGDPQQ